MRSVDPRRFAEPDENHWHGLEAEPTPRSILEHVKLIMACDFAFPIILDRQGRVMDGMHRICRALLDGLDAIPAAQLTHAPEPDFVGRDPEELPYD